MTTKNIKIFIIVLLNKKEITGDKKEVVNIIINKIVNKGKI